MITKITPASPLPDWCKSDDDDLRAITEAKARFPELCGHGMGNGGFAGAERSPIDPGEVHVVRLWIRHQPRTKNPNSRTSSSYGLKHDVAYDMGASVSNGAFIGAAIAEGFIIRRCGPRSPNVYINISNRRVSERCWHSGVQKPWGWLAEYHQTRGGASSCMTAINSIMARADDDSAGGDEPTIQ